MSDFVLYSYFRSSASLRVRIALNLKGIEYDYRPVHLLNQGGEQNAEEYRMVNPSQQVPTLVHRGRAIGQSVAIIEYLDQVQPTPALFPKEAYRAAMVRQACEIINSGIQPLHNLRVHQELKGRFGADQNQIDQWTLFWIERGTRALNDFLEPFAGRYCFGDAVTAADCFLAGHFANVDRYKLSLTDQPKLERIKASYAELDAFQNAGPDRQPDFPK